MLNFHAYLLTLSGQVLPASALADADRSSPASPADAVRSCPALASPADADRSGTTPS